MTDTPNTTTTDTTDAVFKPKIIYRPDWPNGEIEEFKYEIGFFGMLYGVVLSHRYQSKHVCFGLAVEDDEHWFITSNTAKADSYWVADLAEQLMRAEEWMHNNCEWTLHGYEFKDGTLKNEEDTNEAT